MLTSFVFVCVFMCVLYVCVSMCVLASSPFVCVCVCDHTLPLDYFCHFSRICRLRATSWCTWKDLLPWSSVNPSSFQDAECPVDCCNFSFDNLMSWGSSSLVQSLLSCPGPTVHPMFATLVLFLLISRLISMMGPSDILVPHFYPTPQSHFL